MTGRKFKTKLVAEGSMTAIKLPFDVKKEFGKARPPVKVTVEGYTYRSTVAVYDGVYWLPLRKSNREAAGVDREATVNVIVELDTDPRVVEAPKDLAAALKKNKRARERWESLSFTHQREHADAILDAKKPETRARRVAKAIAMLSRQ
jgi:hypothetical protein